jgi:hypothetical protein
MSPAEYREYRTRSREALKYQRWRELRDYDHVAAWPVVADLLDLAVKHGAPKASSGLVEWQRALRRRRT